MAFGRRTRKGDSSGSPVEPDGPAAREVGEPAADDVDLVGPFDIEDFDDPSVASWPDSIWDRSWFPCRKAARSRSN